MCASLLNLIGCTGMKREPLRTQDLLRYHVDCSIKDQQMAWIESHRSMFNTESQRYWMDQIQTEITKCG